MRKYLMIIAIAISFSSIAEESQCTNVDNRNHYLGQNRNQGEVAWCYAFTAADLIAHRYSSKRISASDIAITYNQNRIPQLMKKFKDIYYRYFDQESLRLEHETGFIVSALNSVKKRGYCPEDSFHSEKIYKIFQDDRIQEEIGYKQMMIELDELRTLLEIGLSESEMPFYFSNGFIDKNHFFNILKESKTKDFFFNLTEAACAEDRRKVPENFNVKRVWKFQNMMTKIDEQLNRGHITSIDFFYSFLVDHNKHSLDISELHTTSIVARRLNKITNNCEYLIRNSYGNDCEHYDDFYDCEEGNAWVPAKLLELNSVGITYLE